MSGFGSSSDEDDDEEQDNDEDVNNEVGYSQYVSSLLHTYGGLSGPSGYTERSTNGDLFVTQDEDAEVDMVEDVDYNVDVDVDDDGFFCAQPVGTCDSLVDQDRTLIPAGSKAPTDARTRQRGEPNQESVADVASLADNS
jgi:hypothetical protein